MVPDEPVGCVREFARAVVKVKIHTGEVAHDDQVQVAVVVDVRERCAVRAAVALGLEPGGGGGIGQPTGAVVEQQVAGESVVGVVDRRRHLALHVRQFVLRQPQVRIAIAVDVAGGHHHWIEHFFRCPPSEPSFAGEHPIRLSFNKINAVVTAGDDIHRAVTG